MNRGLCPLLCLVACSTQGVPGDAGRLIANDGPPALSFGRLDDGGFRPYAELESLTMEPLLDGGFTLLVGVRARNVDPREAALELSLLDPATLAPLRTPQERVATLALVDGEGRADVAMALADGLLEQDRALWLRGLLTDREGRLTQARARVMVVGGPDAGAALDAGGPDAEMDGGQSGGQG